MSTPVSVVIAVKDRLESLKNCLYCWRRQDYPEQEYIIVDDGSSAKDGVEAMVYSFQLPNASIVRIENTRDRTPAIAWNAGFSHANGEFVIFTGGDLILSGWNIISEMVKQYIDRRISLTAYFLSKDQTTSLHTVDWKNEPKLIETLSGFWDTRIYWQDNKNIRDGWGAGLVSHVHGATKERWKWFGLFRSEDGHLVSDQDVYLREHQLGQYATTAAGIWAYHQWHPTPSTMAMPGYKYKSDDEARLLVPAEHED